jgi:hypothetical protein
MTAPCSCVPPRGCQFLCRHGATWLDGVLLRVEHGTRVESRCFAGKYGGSAAETPGLRTTEHHLVPRDLGPELVRTRRLTIESSE